MKNTIENKARFFAQYYGTRTEKGRLISGFYINQYMENGNRTFNKLELTPLSAITDEHAIEVAKIIAPEIFMLTKSGYYVDRESNKEWISIKHKRNVFSVDIDYDGYVYKYHEDLGYMRNPNIVSAIDYLRSKGYALPYLGILVEEQIEFGWIKLK